MMYSDESLTGEEIWREVGFDRWAEEAPGVPHYLIRPLLSGPRSSAGSISVEVAALATVWFVLVLGLVQVGVLAYGWLAAEQAARSGAMALARGADPVAAAQAEVPGAWPANVDQTRDTVEVGLEVPSLIPGLPDVIVHGFAGTVIEPDVDTPGKWAP